MERKRIGDAGIFWETPNLSLSCSTAVPLFGKYLHARFMPCHTKHNGGLVRHGEEKAAVLNIMEHER
jgi:hypothetical protein